MTDEQLSETLRSMGPSVDGADTEHALAEVHERASERRRTRNVVRTAIGATAAGLVVIGGLAWAGRDDPGQVVVADQSTTTTVLPPWIVTTSTTDPQTSPAPQTPPPLRDDQLGDVVGVELRTWLFDDQADGFWTASAQQVDAIVAALGGSDETVTRPQYIDHAYVRFTLADGSYALLEMDLESGWIEPNRQLPEDLTRQIRESLNDVVGHPFDQHDLDDPDSYLRQILALTSPPWASPEAALDDLLAAFETERWADYERWYGEVRTEEEAVVAEVRWRGLGDDSARGFDYRFRLDEGPDGWHLESVSDRGLCLRSPSRQFEDTGRSCL